MDIKVLQAFIKEFKDKDIDKKFYALKMYKKLKVVFKMDEIKKILQCDIRCINESIVKAQHSIDKAFNTMLDTLPGTEEYRKAKYEHDMISQEKWLYYGRLGAVEMMLDLIKKHEEKELEEFEQALNEIPYELPF